MGYITPDTLDDALSVLAAGSHSIVAGGTDFYPNLGERQPAGPLIDIRRLPELRGITETATHYRIGAVTSWTEIVKAQLPRSFDGLKAAAREVGSIQIQNAGTIAGNLCNASPAADGVPPLLTLAARVELRSARQMRVLPLAEFITGVRRTTLEPGELVTAVIIPKLPGPTRSAFLKLGARRYLVISICMVAVVLTPDDQGYITDLRVAVGACSPVAKRLHSLEAALLGKHVSCLDRDDLVLTEQLATLSPISDGRGTAEYRLDAVAELIRRGLRMSVATEEVAHA